ncbi:ABC transporter permease [Yinghuangia seranimata]|uniref:ABC transporter permease n=1 Tax=Yinghuangia seranimata TaxID=408067 RepID=UPI00248BF7B8|nr:ABC transporter permease [Yinghuangia seranimata]MDI2128919.1 ABC transporter permease [Yinghuangia seranimata]
MGRYVIRRLLMMIPVFIGTTFLIYYMVYQLGGDPISAMFGDRGADPVFVAQKRAELHLDDSLIVQYWYYLKGLLQGDFGTTLNGIPVADELKRAFPISIRLALVAFAIEVVIGVTAGLIAGLKRGKFADSVVLVVTLVVISIPVFVLGYVLQYFMGLQWGWFPATATPGDPTWEDLILPGIVLGSLSLAFVARLTRTSIVENIRADYVRTATAKGLPRRRVVTVHLLRNSLIPVVTFLGADLGSLMAGAIVTEGIFNVDGVGRLIYLSVTRHESSTVVGAVAALVMIYLVMNLIVDLLYAVLDPRIRYA